MLQVIWPRVDDKALRFQIQMRSSLPPPPRPLGTWTNDDQPAGYTHDSVKLMCPLSFPGVEMQCIGYFNLLFYLLRLQLSAEVQQAALEVISVVTSNQECVNDIAATEVS